MFSKKSVITYFVYLTALVACTDTQTNNNSSSGKVNTGITSPVAQETEFDASQFAVGVKARPLENEARLVIAKDGLIVNGDEGKKTPLIALKRTFTIDASSIYEITVDFEPIKLQGSPALRIIAWSLDEGDAVLSKPAFSAFTKKLDTSTIVPQSITRRFSMVPSKTNNTKKLARPEVAKNILFTTRLMTGGSGSSVKITGFNVSVLPSD